MYKKFINLRRRNFNKFVSINIMGLLSFNILFFKGVFPFSKNLKKSKLKWILDEKDK